MGTTQVGVCCLCLSDSAILSHLRKWGSGLPAWQLTKMGSLRAWAGKMGAFAIMASTWCRTQGLLT